jgi:hypothetical protein
MSKKRLNTEAVISELSGQSVFFRKDVQQTQNEVSDSKVFDGGKEPSNHEPMTPRAHDTMGSRAHDTTIKTIRKAVKQIGKEGATHRFTYEEKRDIADLIYTYKRQRIRTSENEITRIAINFVIQDRNENGENSILDRVLKVLNE